MVGLRVILRELRQRKLAAVPLAMDALRRRVRRIKAYATAHLNRPRRGDVTFVGITGSAGKTTTKELSVAVLKALGPCESTSASHNEHFEIAQAVASVKPSHRSCVIEMSVGGPNYLDYSIKLVKPSIGVLTLIARDHYRAFKSLEAIAAEKGKLIRSLPDDGVAIVNIDDPLVRAIGESCRCRVLWIGRGEGATFRLHDARSQWPEPLTLDLEYEGKRYFVPTQLHGTQQALSVVAALAVGVAAGVSIDEAIARVATAESQSGRMQIIEGADGVTFLRDDWKAPYWSLAAPLAFLKAAQTKRRVAILGTISDYSEKASKIYPKIAKQALASADLVIFVGPHAFRALKARRDPDDGALLAFPEIRDAATHLRSALQSGDLVLLKGSNPADHLVRLWLDRTKAVECWRERCGLARFCNRCPQLYVPSGPRGEREPIAIVPTGGTRAATPNAVLSNVVVGLGNLGVAFDRTPHNAGHLALDAIATRCGTSWEQSNDGWIAEAMLDGISVKLLKPAAAMNKCGPVVKRFLEMHGSDAGHCVLLHDDVDIALGEVRLKRNGGDAGHRGVRSVIAALGTGEIRRVRIGVRRPGDARQATQFVLRDFEDADLAMLRPALQKSTALVASCLASPAERSSATASLES
jgi:UDP-N-acetylmuramoyl-tripeptide--D-alanyl-D-alanine ligase